MIAQGEIDILYDTLNKLTHAQSPAEQLEAVSGYARSTGATGGVLFFLDNPNAHDTIWSQVVAAWSIHAEHAIAVGTRFRAFATSMINRDTPLPIRPILVSDVEADERVDVNTRQLLQSFGARAIAQLPLNNNGRWIGSIFFGWNTPHTFDERDSRIFTALLQQIAPVIDSARLLEQTRSRALRSEYLLRLNTALSQAEDEALILEAIALYTVEQGAALMTLDYPDEAGFRRIAVWEEGAARLCDFPVLLPEPEEQETALFVDDVLNDERFESLADEMRAFVMLPLYSVGRYQGVLTIGWRERHTFSSQERYIYNALLQTLPSIVASRRAYLSANEAWQESELLYWASKHINAATSFSEIVQAVEAMNKSSYNVVLTVFENFDFDRASYADIVAGGSRSTHLVGTRHPMTKFPTITQMPRDQMTVIEDVLNDPRVDETSAKNWLKLDTRSRVGVPLTLNNRWMGNLIFYSEQPRVYTEFEKRLLAGIGELVTAAMDRIRLQMEREASHQRAEMLAEISARLSQAQDEQEILSAVAPLAQRCNVVLSMLAYANTDLNGNIIEVKTVAIAAPEVGYMDTTDLPLLAFQFKDFPQLKVAYEKPNEVIFIDDAHAFGFPTAVIVPLQTGHQWQGILTFMWTSSQVFSEEMHAIFSAIQPAAASIVASRRAFLRERQRAHELETVAKVSAVAATILDVNKLLNSVTELVHFNFPDYQIFIYLLDDSGRNMTLASGYRRFGIPQKGIKFDLSSKDCLVARVGQLKEGIIVNDILKSPDFTPCQMLPNARSEIAVPMVAGDKLIGVLNVQSQVLHRFTEADLWVMRALADLTAVAIQNARLYRSAQEIAVFEERNRLARELHDSVSQALYGIALGARTARELLNRNPSALADPLNYILSLADGGLNEMRALIFELRPETLENEGLISALTKQTVSIKTRHGIDVQTVFCSEPDVDISMKEAVYRIAREALHNITKHAHATQVVLRVECDTRAISLEIVDNGAGFDPHGDFPGHLGLKSMRERATRLNGTFDLISAPGRGTAILVRIPRPVDDELLQPMTEITTS